MKTLTFVLALERCEKQLTFGALPGCAKSSGLACTFAQGTGSVAKLPFDPREFIKSLGGRTSTTLKVFGESKILYQPKTKLWRKL